MSKSNDVRALKTTTTELENAQIKIIASNQCNKAQAFLLDRLRKQSERYKEACNYNRRYNFKLESDIQLAEKQVKSLNAALETIQQGNIDINKEYLLAKESKADILEIIKDGTKKYDKICLETKERYESFPIIKQLMEVKKKNEGIQVDINNLNDETKTLTNQIKIKKNELASTDKERIIQLTEYFVHERPKTLKKINELRTQVKEANNRMELMLKKIQQIKSCSNLHNEELDHNRKHLPTVIKTVNDPLFEDSWSNKSMNVDNDKMLLPKLHLQNNDLDIIRVKLDQIKKVDFQNNLLVNTAGSSVGVTGLKDNPQTTIDRDKIIEHDVSSYFNVIRNVGDIDTKPQCKKNSDRKLIHILEDIQLSNNDTLTLLRTLKPKIQLDETKYVTLYAEDQVENNLDSDKQNKSLEIEEIDEIDMTKKGEEIVAPPSQFLDMTQNTQEKKSVTFNILNENETLLEDETKGDETIISKSQEDNFNTSTVSNGSYTTMKENILKKHNLDLSPQFVYGKNTLMQMRKEDVIVTSNFFEKEAYCSQRDDNIVENNKKLEPDQLAKCTENKTKSTDSCSPQKTSSQNMNFNKSLPDPKGGIQTSEVPMAGFLFNHGPSGIPDSLDVSTGTTGFEDDEDFPRCIDSSLLLSPKADIPAATSSGKNDVLSQEVPNFLAGFRKTGLSFFGNPTTSDSKPDSSDQGQSSGFNFNFGKEEKKGRGGLFSMFR